MIQTPPEGWAQVLSQCVFCGILGYVEMRVRMVQGQGVVARMEEPLWRPPHYAHSHLHRCHQAT